MASLPSLNQSASRRAASVATVRVDGAVTNHLRENIVEGAEEDGAPFGVAVFAPHTPHPFTKSYRNVGSCSSGH